MAPTPIRVDPLFAWPASDRHVRRVVDAGPGHFPAYKPAHRQNLIAPPPPKP
jgi:hypothetical protein